MLYFIISSMFLFNLYISDLNCNWRYLKGWNIVLQIKISLNYCCKQREPNKIYRSTEYLQLNFEKGYFFIWFTLAISRKCKKFTVLFSKSFLFIDFFIIFLIYYYFILEVKNFLLSTFLIYTLLTLNFIT